MCTQTRRNGELLYIEYDIVDLKKKLGRNCMSIALIQSYCNNQ